MDDRKRLAERLREIVVDYKLAPEAANKVRAAALALEGMEGRTSAGKWRTDLENAPKDGTHFLASTLTTADELDDDDHILRKNVKERHSVVAYWCFGGFITYPYTGSIPINVHYTHWQPLPEPPQDNISATEGSGLPNPPTE